MDNEYKNASYKQQQKLENNVAGIINNTLDHEFRIAAQRLLVQMESYRHAEELVRNDGSTKITIVQIQETKEIIIAKNHIIKEDIIRASNKEITLINAIGNSPELIDIFLERLDSVSNDIKYLNEKFNLYSHEILNLNHLMKSSEVEAIEYKYDQTSYAWADKLWEWADKTVLVIINYQGF